MLTLWFFLLLPVTQTVQAALSIVVSSSQATNPASNAVDGKSSTFWHSEYSPVPHYHTPYTLTQAPCSFSMGSPIFHVRMEIIIGTLEHINWLTLQEIFGLSQHISAVYNFTTGATSSVNVSNTQHDMFCPEMSLIFDGKAIVTGGDTANKTSIYDSSTDQWVAGPVMKIPRGYQSTTTTSTGKVFNIGGSWSGCPVAPMLTADAQGAFRTDNHAWLFAWKNGAVFQAGPSKAMNWYGTTATGSQKAAGLRASDIDSMCGNAVMYDAVNGKIFTAGGSPSYQNSDATNPNEAPTVQILKSMTYKRAFANCVVLPDGKVLVTEGQPYAVPFIDTDAVLTPGLWDPTTQTFTILPPHTIPRTYHSIALLMLDGRVFTGGGGLCGSSCATNHADEQIYRPAYLFTSNGTAAIRPVIFSAISTVAVGGTVTITTDTAVTSFLITRYGSATHTVNTDQRRIALTPVTASGSTYTFTIPNDPGIALPGYWARKFGTW
ncbi:hypothetical protein EAF04_004078 [Stromatinia cepivora]|nr:hypothetical protein EAF04_004078 [Stromatinia cepivora]